MAEKYHYDKDGKYQGKTSDTPPSTGDGCGALIAIVIVVALISKCSGSSSSSSTAPVEAPQTYSAPAEPAANIEPTPQPYEPPSTAPESNPGEEFEFEGK